MSPATASPRPNAARALLPALFAVAIAAFWAASSGRPFYFALDDAYITLHNARTLWTGVDVNYGVPPLVGATSLVHLALVAALLPLAGPVAADIAIGLAGALAYLWAVERLAARHGLGLAATAALLLTAAGSGYAALHLCNGLETSLVLAAVTWAVVLADRDRPSRALAALCGVLPFLHPELALLSAALLLRQAWRRWRAGPLRPIAIDFAVAALVACPWIAWSFAETGSVLPNTAAAKIAFFADAGRPLAWKAAMGAQGLVIGVGLPLLALLFVRPSSLALALWGFALAFLGASLSVYASGLVGYGGRYTVALLPLCLWALCAWPGARRIRDVLLAVCAVLAVLGLVHSRTELLRLAGMSADEAAAVAWADRTLPHDQIVLVHDAGVSAYASTLQLRDLVGLKTPSATPVHMALTAPNGGAGRGRAIARIAADNHARFAIIHHVAFWSDIADDLRLAGWRLDLVRPRGRAEGYDVYRLTPPA